MERKVRAGPDLSLWTLGQAFCFVLFFLLAQQPEALGLPWVGLQGASCVHDSPSPEAWLPAANAWLLFSSLVKTQNASLQEQSEMQSAGPLARKGLSLASPLPSPAAPVVPGKGCQRGATG